MKIFNLHFQKIFHFSFRSIFTLVLLVAPPNVEALTNPIHHELKVTIDLQKSRAQIHDLISISPGSTASSTINFLIRGSYGLEMIVVHQKGDWTVDTESIKEEGVRLKRLQIKKPPDQSWPDLIELEVQYSGSYIPRKRPKKSKGKTTKQASGKEGILLAAGSYFYPVFEGNTERPLITFKMTVDTPEVWKVVSQGKRISETVVDSRRTVVWKTENPMQEIFLVGDRFVEYQATYKKTKLYTFLRDGNTDLAGKYLEAASRYIKMYEEVLGPYPFPKFAMVENAKQTGYGMPSFTLLGSKIIRFPFILKTSYPHEILHNWFGNSIYPDPLSGNWSEGLTTYLSDHLFPEQEGKGDQYRFQAMMKYMNYVNDINDMPLNKFSSRDSMASQAIGYSKMLMFFHMLRKEVGDKIFLAGLRKFYEDRKFKYADFEVLRSVMESLSKKKLSPFFRQWTMRSGGPELALTLANVRKKGDGFKLEIELNQKQKSGEFILKLPVAVWLKGASTPLIKNIVMDSKKQSYSWGFPEEPASVMIDPYYDVFRRLNREEVPSSLSQSFGDHESYVVLPNLELSDRLMSRYKTAALSLTLSQRIIKDLDYSYSTKKTTFLFGQGNRAIKELRPILQKNNISFDSRKVTIEGKLYSWKDHSFVFTVAHPEDNGKSITWIVANQPVSLPGLMNKLPHYGKYGYLVFKGPSPDNLVKGVWPTKREGLSKNFRDGSYALPLTAPLISP
jgi:aminopeptidase N